MCKFKPTTSTKNSSEHPQRPHTGPHSHQKPTSSAGPTWGRPQPRPLPTGGCAHLEVPVVHTVEGLEEGRRRGHVPGEAPLHPEARTEQLEASACPARGPWRPSSSKHRTPWEPCTLPARGRPSCLSLGPNLCSGQNLTPIPVACQTNDPVELTRTKTHILYRVSRDAGLRATGCPLGPYPTEGAPCPT